MSINLPFKKNLSIVSNSNVLPGSLLIVRIASEVFLVRYSNNIDTSTRYPSRYVLSLAYKGILSLFSFHLSLN